MNCSRFDDLLNEYVDGARASERPGDRPLAAFEHHLSGCARCQALVADFTSIRTTATTLEDHVPPPRIWANIAAAVENRQSRVRAWVPLAAAASVAGLLAGGTWIAWQHSTVDPSPTTTVAQTDMVLPAEAQYEQAIVGLQQLADAQDRALDPETRAVLKENLAVINRAIDESRAAVADEPANAFAQESLLDALETKVALLQDTVALTSEELNQ